MRINNGLKLILIIYKLRNRLNLLIILKINRIYSRSYIL